MRRVIGLLAMVLLSILPLVAGEEREDKRLESAGKVLGEIMNVPETAPKYILDRADCVIVMPGVKKGSAFIFSAGFGGTFGRGAMSCRTGQHFDRAWGAPTMVALEGMRLGNGAGRGID